MRFLNPAYLNFLWLALIPIALWLFRRKARRVPVSTLLFFRTLAREHQESAWLRWLKRWLSLLLTLLVLLASVLALARPFRQGGEDTPKSLVILLDRSASMASKDDKGKTRLDVAKELLRDRLKALPENIIASLIFYDGKPEVAQSRSTNHRELLRLLDRARPLPIADRPEEAWTAARRLAELDAPVEVWHVSDHPLSETLVKEATEAAGDEKKVGYRFFDLSLEKPSNVGITAFQVRPAPLARNRFEAFVEVTASLSNSGVTKTTLEVRLDDRPVQLREMDLAPGASSRLVLPLEGGKGQRIEMEIRAEKDALVWDNIAVARLPETKPLILAWLTENPDPFTELALTSLLAEDRIQVLKGGAKDWPLKDQPDVYVFENWLPPAWPADKPALVLNPPASLGPVHAKRLERSVPYDSVRSLQPDHPVLFRVSSPRVAVSQTTVLNVSDTLETLWMAGNEPVLAAGEANGQRVVVTGFQPAKSEQLALLSAFPLLIGNAIYWCAENSDALASLTPRQAGDVVSVEPGLIRWQVWDGQRLVEQSMESKTGLLELDQVGIFEPEKGPAESSLLLSANETNLPAKQPAVAGGTEKGTQAHERWAGGGSWWAALLWFVLALLLIESWLFHREAVY